MKIHTNMWRGTLALTAGVLALLGATFAPAQASVDATISGLGMQS